MKTIFSSFILFLVLLIPMNSYAGKIMTIKKGQVAPYSGHLLDTKALSKIVNKSKYSLKECKLEKEYIIKSNKNKSQFEIKLCKNKQKSIENIKNKIIKIQAEELKKLRKLIVPKPDLKPLWIAIGLVVGVGATIAIVYAVKPTFQGATQ